MSSCSCWFLEILHLSLPLCTTFEEFGYSFCIHYSAYPASSTIPCCSLPSLVSEFLLFPLIFSTRSTPMFFLLFIVQLEAHCFPLADDSKFPCFLFRLKEFNLASIRPSLNKQQNGELIKSGKNLWKQGSLYKLSPF